MKTINLVEEAGPDKMLKLSIPVDEPNRRYQLVIVIEPEPQPTKGTPEERDWPPGFFEKTAGSIQDDTFKRHEQDEYEKRLELE